MNWWSRLSPTAPRMASKTSSNLPAQALSPLGAFQMYNIRTTVPRIPWMSSEVVPCIFSGVYHHENVQQISFSTMWACQGFSKFTTAASELLKLLVCQLNLLEFAKEPMADFLRACSWSVLLLQRELNCFNLIQSCHQVTSDVNSAVGQVKWFSKGTQIKGWCFTLIRFIALIRILALNTCRKKRINLSCFMNIWITFACSFQRGARNKGFFLFLITYFTAFIRLKWKNI